MKYNQLKSCMNLTEDFSKTYKTKHGKEINRDNLGDAKDSYTEIQLSGEDSRTMTVHIQRLLDNSKIEKKAKAVAKAARLNIAGAIGEKYADEVERIEKVVIKTKSIMATLSKPGKPTESYDIKKHLTQIYTAYPKLIEAFEALKAVSTSPKKPSAQTVRVDTIKSEAISDYARKLWSYLKNSISPVIDEMEILLSRTIEDFQTAGDEFRDGVDDMVDNPDYHMDRNNPSYNLGEE